MYNVEIVVQRAIYVLAHFTSIYMYVHVHAHNIHVQLLNPTCWKVAYKCTVVMCLHT